MTPQACRKKLTANHFVASKTLACIAACALLIGCRQKAYTELYVEQMASENRMLEDRVFEFDAAYQTLEQENEEQKRINQRLERKLAELRDNDESSSSSNRNKRNSPSKPLIEPEPYLLPGNPKSGNSKTDESKINKPGTNGPGKTPSILNDRLELEAPSDASDEILEPPAVLRTSPSSPPPVASPNTEPNLPPPAKEQVPAKPGADIDAILPSPDPQALNLRKRKNSKAGLPDEQSLVEEVDLPNSMNGFLRKGTKSTPALPVGTAPSETSPPILVNPPKTEAITPGNQNSSEAPSLLPKALRNLNANPQSKAGGGKVRMPEGSQVQWASATTPIEQNDKKKIQDLKIVEVAFHPTMCRGHNFDDTPGDDGLYLVVTPVNQSGEVINEPGFLTIIVEEDGVDESEARIAAWELSKTELQEMLTPIGAAQGFHLSLPWDSGMPKGQNVTVYIRYKLEDGRTLVNKRNIRLRTQSKGQSVWTPR